MTITIWVEDSAAGIKMDGSELEFESVLAFEPTFCSYVTKYTDGPYRIRIHSGTLTQAEIARLQALCRAVGRYLEDVFPH